MNVAEALLQIGDWDAAEAELTQALDSDALRGHGEMACERGWLAALRGDAGTAEAMLTALRELRASEDPQDQSLISLLEAFAAAARAPAPTLCAMPGRSWLTPRHRDQRRGPALGVAAGRALCA